MVATGELCCLSDDSGFLVVILSLHFICTALLLAQMCLVSVGLFSWWLLSDCPSVWLSVCWLVILSVCMSDCSLSVFLPLCLKYRWVDCVTLHCMIQFTCLHHIFLFKGIETCPSEFSLRDKLYDSGRITKDQFFHAKIFLFVGGIRSVKDPLYLVDIFAGIFHAYERGRIFLYFLCFAGRLIGPEITFSDVCLCFIFQVRSKKASHIKKAFC